MAMIEKRKAVLSGLIVVLFLLSGTESLRMKGMHNRMTGVLTGGIGRAFELPMQEVKNVADTAAAIVDTVTGGGPSQECYGDLGCLALDGPWTSLARPVPAPWSPHEILAGATLYTRYRPHGFYQSLNRPLNLFGSDFDPNRQVTVFITHGIANNGDRNWLHKLKNAYLNDVDANVFILDWGNGACKTNYLQVVSNSRIVGTQLAGFIRYLISYGQTTNKLHLIGHCVGAHVMSYASKEINTISKVQRITALDPAQPAFEGLPAIVRLDRSDAYNIDVFHTDAKPFLPFLGFGMINPVGSVDFYFNGGSLQPGCLDIKVPNIHSLGDLLAYPVEVVYQWISCSHDRAHEYFTLALELRNCSFWGRKMSNTENFLKVATLGRLTLADPIVSALTSCTRETCTVAGLDTFNLPGRGSFAVTTRPDSPYCEAGDDDRRHLKNLLTLGVYDQAPKPARKLFDTISIL